LDPTLGEFWVSNPWDIVKQGHNLSAFERSRMWLNLRGQGFLDVSYLSGADDDGDGRSVVPADFRNTGRLDLVVRKAGGQPVQLYENNFPQQHYLKVTLRGTGGNRSGIGARLVAEVAGQRMSREMYPLNSFRSQAPNVVHFGLGDHDRVDRLMIRWPSGKEQLLTDVAADRHIVVEERMQGPLDVETVVPGSTIRP
jgi:hypothetical protein